MTDLICRKTMMRCQTPGMCSPHGGCPETYAMSNAWMEQLRSENLALGQKNISLIAENERLREDRKRIRQQRMEYASKYEDAYEKLDECLLLMREAETKRDQLRIENNELNATLQAEKSEIERLSKKLMVPAKIAEALGRHKSEISVEAFGLKREGMEEAQKACDRIAGDALGRGDRERKGAGECSSAIRALIATLDKESMS